MSTKNVNKNDTKPKATHKRTYHNAKKMVYRYLHSSSVLPFLVSFLFNVDFVIFLIKRAFVLFVKINKLVRLKFYSDIFCFSIII